MVCAIEKPEFETLLRPLLKELAGTALSLTHDRSRAEDLVQETLLRAYRSYDHFEPGTHFKAWIHRILYNTFVSDFRKRRGRNERTLPDDMDTEDRRRGSDLTSNDLDEISEHLDDPVKQALGRLNPEFREVFIRAAIDDSTNEEIARSLKIPVGTVMSRLHRARSFLRHELQMTQ